jgi:DNA-binding NtrC family response regulator
MSKLKQKILIVDDDTDVGWLLQNLLGRLDCEFQIANTGQEALAFIKKNTPDLIFLDIKLPDMSGLRILKEVREMGQKGPVIIITSFGTDELQREADQWDVLHLLNKPFEVDRIQRLAQEALTISEEILREK